MASPRTARSNVESGIASICSAPWAAGISATWRQPPMRAIPVADHAAVERGDAVTVVGEIRVAEKKLPSWKLMRD